jgi:hypothetical protein
MRSWSEEEGLYAHVGSGNISVRGRPTDITEIRSAIRLQSRKDVEDLTKNDCLEVLRLLKMLGYDNSPYFKQLPSTISATECNRSIFKTSANGARIKELHDRIANYLGLTYS